MALFTVAEAKAFVVGGETPLAPVADAVITAAEARIKERFEDICEVAFEPTEVTATLDGKGATGLVLPHTRVTEVEGVAIDGTEVDVADTKLYDYGVLYYSSGWGNGVQDVEVTYTHGYAAVPKAIKWAALVVAVEEIMGSDVTKRAITQTDDIGTFRMSVPDGEKERWYGIPAVDAVLSQYSEKVPAIG